MFSSPSYAKWTKVSESVDGDTFYVDFKSIKKSKGYTYVWSLDDYVEPFKESGILSLKTYMKIDCNSNGYKRLSWIGYKTSMGKEPHFFTNSNADKNWKYYPPESSWDIAIKKYVVIRD